MLRGFIEQYGCGWRKLWCRVNHVPPGMLCAKPLNAEAPRCWSTNSQTFALTTTRRPHRLRRHFLRATLNTASTTLCDSQHIYAHQHGGRRRAALDNFALQPSSSTALVQARETPRRGRATAICRRRVAQPLDRLCYQMLAAQSPRLRQGWRRQLEARRQVRASEEDIWRPWSEEDRWSAKWL